MKDIWVDTPGGWRYGFPKPLPADYSEWRINDAL